MDNSIFAIALIAATAQAHATRDPRPLAQALAQATRAGVSPTSDPMVQAITLLNTLNQEVLHPGVAVNPVAVTANTQLLPTSGQHSTGVLSTGVLSTGVQLRPTIATVESPTIGEKRFGKIPNGRVFRDDGDDVTFEVTVRAPVNG